MDKKTMPLDIHSLYNGIPHKQAEVSDEAPIAIIGTGDYARALAKRLCRNERKVLCGSRYPQRRNIAGRDPEIANLDVKVVSIPQAIQEADIIFLALHSDHIDQALRDYHVLLSGKVLVDVSNPNNANKNYSQAERLSRLYPQSHIVKAFNTISAYALESDHDEGDKKVYIASDSKEAAKAVAEVANSIGLETVLYGKLQSAGRLESMQLSLFRGWGAALIISAVIFLAWGVYGTYRYHVKKGHAWSRWPVNTMNKVYACTALTLLPMCYLPGIIASIVQLIQGTKHRAFPNWLDKWMRSRKQLGLLALWLAGIHCVLSVAHLSPAYFSKWFDIQTVTIPANHTENVKVPIDVRLNWKGETAICLGTLALGIMALLGISSLPSVGSKLNWKQWKFIQSYMGYICLAVATAHVTMKGAPYWTSKPFASTVIGMSFLSLVIPYITMFLRLILALPCFSIVLYKIRRGWECCQKAEKHTCNCGGTANDKIIVASIPSGIENLSCEMNTSVESVSKHVSTVEDEANHKNVEPLPSTSSDFHPNYESVHLP